MQNVRHVLLFQGLLKAHILSHHDFLVCLTIEVVDSSFSTPIYVN